MICSGTLAATPREGASLRLLTAARWLCFGLFLASLGLVSSLATGLVSLAGNPGWPQVLLLLAATGSTLLSLTRELPAQNVLLAAAVIGGLGSLLQMIGAGAALPIAPPPDLPGGIRPLMLRCWWLPLVWIVTLLNARGTARLILRPRLQTPTSGFQVLALTTALSLLFIAGLVAFATAGYESGFPPSAPAGPDGIGISPGHFLVLLPATLFLLVLATPALINKKPAPLPVVYFPLIAWVLSNLLFALVAATHQRWGMAALGSTAAMVALGFALRGVAKTVRF